MSRWQYILCHQHHYSQGGDMIDSPSLKLFVVYPSSLLRPHRELWKRVTKKSTLRTNRTSIQHSRNKRIFSPAENCDLIVIKWSLCWWWQGLRCSLSCKHGREHEISCRNRAAAAFCSKIEFTNSNSQAKLNRAWFSSSRYILKRKHL